MLATQKGLVGMVKTLLKSNANPNIQEQVLTTFFVFFTTAEMVAVFIILLLIHYLGIAKNSIDASCI